MEYIWNFRAKIMRFRVSLLVPDCYRGRTRRRWHIPADGTVTADWSSFHPVKDSLRLCNQRPHDLIETLPRRYGDNRIDERLHFPSIQLSFASAVSRCQSTRSLYGLTNPPCFAYSCRRASHVADTRVLDAFSIRLGDFGRLLAENRWIVWRFGGLFVTL